MSNFLGLRCPKWRTADGIEIQATTWIRVSKDGTETGDSEWGEHRYTPQSPYAATLRDFELEDSAES